MQSAVDDDLCLHERPTNYRRPTCLIAPAQISSSDDIAPGSPLGLGRTARRGCEKRRPCQQGGDGWVKAMDIAAKAEEGQTRGRRRGPREILD